MASTSSKTKPTAGPALRGHAPALLRPGKMDAVMVELSMAAVCKAEGPRMICRPAEGNALMNWRFWRLIGGHHNPVQGPD
jgi:hypothetical protein